MRGRKPVPNKLKLLRGNPSKTPINLNEPKLKPGLPKRPTWLKGLAKRCWEDLGGTLERVRVVTHGDGAALELLSDAYLEYRTARAVVLQQGMTYTCTTKSGEVVIKARPEVRIASDAWKRLKGILAEFGFTPSSRTRIDALEDSEPDPLEEFLAPNQRSS